MLKIPNRAANFLIKNFLGKFSAEAVIIKNYYSNALKWRSLMQDGSNLSENEGVR